MIESWRGECEIIDGKPVIKLGGHQVPEYLREQAAANMRLRPDIKANVIELLGEEEARKRYPEAWDSGREGK
jgi:hypothetical protein